MSLFKNQFEFPILQVKNLPYETDSDELYNLFGQQGNVLEIRLGSDETKGQALVIYKNYKDCVDAVEKLKGVNLKGRYIVCSLYQIDKYEAMKLRDQLTSSKDGDEWETNEASP
ncbi:unnamed protein product [Ambrosiozyma monospora]|uniref:Unnamed protein product n=1 Tax=Ambrosiozyma monospora TaxID=43982 RepID=A0ACB5UB89_AMBMO|nr:unnamed protein product [Ambrosiozyma monospora]